MRKMAALISGVLSVMALLMCACSAGTANNTFRDWEYIAVAPEAGALTKDIGTLEERKVIKNADVTCSTDDVLETYQTILSWLKQNDGYESSQNMTKRDEQYTISAVFKIVPEKLDALLDVIDSHTEIVNLRTSTDDVTQSYADTQLRLKSRQAALDQYYALMEKAVSVDEVLSIQKAINDLTIEIESMEVGLLSWDKKVGECTVTVTFTRAETSLGLLRWALIFFLFLCAIALVVFITRIVSKNNRKQS
ncbi:MAG: DUF4349 domain-containing protein [Dehalococcoidia bacterium]|nr:DUF4349 domain-containing protein [Dehalococcoidia bacterium]